MAHFRGGMEFAAGRPIRLPSPPPSLPVSAVRLRCHERPEVAQGQAVRQGQVLLRPTQTGGWHQVSPIAGMVRSVDPVEEVDALGASRRGYEVAIEANTPQSPTALEVASPRGRRLEAWFAALRQIGSWSDRDGGVGFIAQLAAAQTQPIDTVVCMGLDAFPPYPDASSLLLSFPDDAVLGTIIVADLVAATRSMMLAPDNRTVLSRLGTSCRNYNLKLAVSPNLYPAADPMLVAWSHGGRRRVARGGNPAAQGLVMLHPWTAIRIGRWFTLQRFDLVRPIFLAWPGGRPSLMALYAMPGQPLESLDARLATQLEADPSRVLLGNPMTGRRVTAPNAASVSTWAPTSAPSGSGTPGASDGRPGETAPPPVPRREHAVPDDELIVSVIPDAASPPAEACISCGWCVEVCPTSLRPIHLAQLASRHPDDDELHDHLDWCMDCGLCTHVCPSSIPLAQTLRQAARGPSHRRHAEAQAIAVASHPGQSDALGATVDEGSTPTTSGAGKAAAPQDRPPASG